MFDNIWTANLIRWEQLIQVRCPSCFIDWLLTRSWNQVEFISTSNVTLCCLQALLLEGRSVQLMSVINIKTASDPGELSSGWTAKPNFILKAAILRLGLSFS